MAKYKLLEKAFINDRLWETDEIVDVPDDVTPGPHMLPLDAAAHQAALRQPGQLPQIGLRHAQGITQLFSQHAFNSHLAAPAAIRHAPSLERQLLAVKCYYTTLGYSLNV